MPRRFADDELQQRRDALRALDAQGQGLKSARFRQLLEELGNYFTQTAQGLEREIAENDDSKKKKELALYLKQAGEAFQDLTADNVLEDGPDQLEAEKNSKFEEALRRLSDLPRYLLDRDEKGDLLFTHMERAGVPLRGEAYRRGDLLTDLASLDTLLNLDFGPAAEQIEPELSEEKKQEYLEKGPVRDLLQDPDAKMAVELLNPASEVYTTLQDLIRVLSPHQDDRTLKRNAQALRDVANRARKTEDPIALRTAILQMTQQIKMVRECYESRDYRPGAIHLNGSNDNVVFPPDPAKLNLDEAEAFLIRYFDENDPKVLDQVKANTNQTKLIVPKNDPLRLLYHLSANQADGSVTPDNAMLYAVTDVLDQKRYQIKDRAVRVRLQEVMRPLFVLRNFVKENIDEHGWTFEKIKTESDKISNLLKTTDDELVEFDKVADEETKKFVHRVLNPFRQRLANMDVENISRKYDKLDFGPAPQQAAWEIPDPQAANQQGGAEQENLRLYSDGELYATRVELYDGFYRRLVKNSLDDLMGQNNALAVYDANGEKCWVGQEGADYMLWLNRVRQELPGIFTKLKNNFDTNKENTLTAQEQKMLLADLRESGQTFRDIAAKARNYNEETQIFINACKKMAESIDKALEKAVEPNRHTDALKAYVAFHAGSHMNVGDKEKLEASAKVAGAYQWAQENNYRPGKKISVSAFNEKALELQKNPCFLEYFRNRKAEPEVDPNDPEGKPKYKVNRFALENAVKYSRSGGLVNVLRRPLVYGVSREEKLQALKELRKYGDVLDHCSGASKKYKKFYHSLKDLSLLDLDRMSNDELGKRLQDVYDKTAQYMKGNKAVSWFKVRREHFEQALDVLSVIQRCGVYGQRLADSLVKRTNTVRGNKLFKQPTVDLKGRSPEKTAKRLAACRGIVATEQSRDIIALIEKQMKQAKLTRASEAADVRNLPELPQDVEKRVKLSDKMAQIRSFLESGGYNFNDSNARVPEMLALTITPAYKQNGEIVLDEAQYQRNVRVMKQHLAAVDLVREYSEDQKRTQLRQHENANKCGQLRLEFNEKEQVINDQIEAQDQQQMGQNYKLTDEEVRQKINDQRLQINKRLEERQSLDRADEKLKSKRAEFGLNEPVPPKRDADEPQSNVLNKFRKNLNMDQKEEKQKTAEELNQERKEFRGLNA